MVNNHTPPLYLFSIFLLFVLVITPSVAAVSNNTYTLGSNDLVRYNVSVSQAPTSSTPWDLWIISGFLGLVLFIYSLRSRTASADVEVDAIISVLAWVPIAFCSYASFAIDKLTSYGVTSQVQVPTCGDTEQIQQFVLMEQHLLYTQPIIGVLMLVFLLIAIGNTLRIISLHRALQGQV